MKKFAKMSLVAAIAVAGLTTANAKPLEEAIKGVDISGTVAYRYEEANADLAAAASRFGSAPTAPTPSFNRSEGDNYYKAVVDMVIPAGDDFTMGLSFQAGDAAPLSTSTVANPSVDNAGVDVHLTGANFTYSGIANTTITAGMQAIPTPWTVAADAMGTTHSGTGILALSTQGPVTLAGAYFNQTDIAAFAAGQDIWVIGALGSVAGVNLEAFYADARDFLDSYTLAGSYKLDLDGIGLAFSLRYTELELDSAPGAEHDVTQGSIKLTAGMFDASVAYGETGSNGGLVAFDPTAKTTMEGWNTALGTAANNEYLKLSVGAKVLPSVHVSLNYNDLDTSTANFDETETYLQVKYQATKSLSTYVRLGELEVGNLDGSAGRVHVQYSF